ncbi:MAG: SAM-dependent methyltransferase [Myxococcales bacterium]|nr:SAM-dependent methyltransferase [Myxococcales bacterium]
MRKSNEPFVASPNLAYFQRHGQIYAYHNVFGYLLSMSPDVVSLIEFHRDQPRTETEVIAHFGSRFEDGQLAEFLTILELYSALIEPDSREESLLWAMVPVRGRWVVTHQPSDTELTFWHVPTERADAGPPSEQVPPWAARLWRLMDGERALKFLVDEIKDDPGLLSEPNPEDAVLNMLAGWVHSSRQYLRFSKVALSRFGKEHQWPAYLKSTMPYAKWVPGVDPPPVDPFEQLAVPIAPPHAYYENEVSDPETQFREVETTLSYLFRDPSPILYERTYADCIATSLFTRGHLGAHTRHILEVGAGTGDFAAGFLGHLQKFHPELYSNVTYTILDLSPALRGAQAARLARDGLADKVRFREGNAELILLPQESVDLVLCNEVIGDFTTVKLTRELLGITEDESGAESYQNWDEVQRQRLGETGEMLLKYGISLADAPDEFYFNLGAIKFIANLFNVVRPGGSVFVTEYGQLLSYPIAATHLDHLEFSIHFGHLMKVAGEVGFLVDFVFLLDLLEMDREATTLATTRTQFASLRALLESYGITLEKKAYTKDMFEELLNGKLQLADIGGIRFEPVDERCMGLAPHEFKALLLKRPEIPAE